MLQYLMNHSTEIMVALVAIHAAANAIVVLTPTPKDDIFVAKVYKIVEVLGGVFGKAKDGGK